ncbi:MAG: hypothetical protein QG650_737 [Patescibacteria group bacterium]|nr:hypothetical protein [Patescibacteria group bacterium]
MGVLFFGIFAFLGSGKSYSAFYGAVVGVGIYIVLQTLLGPTYQTAETAKVLSPGISQFLIGSSAYLIPILFFLGPINGGLQVKGMSNPVLRGLESGTVAVFAVALVCASAFGFMSKTYVFTVDTAFTLLKDSAGFSAFVAASKAFSYLIAHLQTVVLSAILFAIYRAFFAEIVTAAGLGVIKAVFKRGGGKGGGKDDHAGHDDHGDGHGDEEDDHAGHDDHGGHGHGGGHGHH